MVQVRVQRKGLDFNQIAKDLSVDIQYLKKGTLEGMADIVAQRSPADTGLYAVSHEIGLRSGSFQNSSIRPSPDAPRNSRGGNVSIEGARAQGRANMQADIEALDLTAESFVIRNPHEQAPYIEAGATGNRTGAPPVYAAASREGGTIAQQVAARIRARNR